MKIAITGTRGIPNQYGGFEQFAEFLSTGLSASGHQVWVYNPRFHSYDKDNFKGVEIIRKRFPEKLLGSAGNYLYDLACIRDALQRKADIVLECGYASAAPWYPFLRFGETRLVTHMDGMEGQREKWGRITRKLFLLAEKMAVRHSDALICDHPEIARYYQEKYSVKTEMITYGADPGADHGDGHGNYLNPGILDKFRLKSGEYYLLVARLEPENNIRMIIEGFLASEASVTTGALDSSGASGFSTPLVIIGKHDRGYGKTIFREFGKDQRIRFLGDLYDPARLNGLRHFSKAQFHGHSVGGTNPSLLEAMAAGASIIAHDNVYTRWVLGDNAVYFSSAGEIKDLISNANDQEFNNLIDPGVGGNPSNEANIAHNLKRIREDFQWNDIVRLYEDLFRRLVL